MRRTFAVGMLAVTAALTSCTSDTDTTSKTTPPPQSTTAAPSPSEAVPAPPRALGETRTITFDDGTTFAMTVMGYEQDVAKNSVSADEEFNTHGYVWAAVEIKACLKTGEAGVTRYPWALAYADGTRIEPSGVTYGDFPKPEYPYEAELKTGECVRGKTVFPVPGDQRPERILYTADGLPEPVEWAVPKQ